MRLTDTEKDIPNQTEIHGHTGYLEGKSIPTRNACTLWQMPGKVQLCRDYVHKIYPKDNETRILSTWVSFRTLEIWTLEVWTLEINTDTMHAHSVWQMRWEGADSLQKNQINSTEGSPLEQQLSLVLPSTFVFSPTWLPQIEPLRL
jgi:hypothetical protein